MSHSANADPPDPPPPAPPPASDPGTGPLAFRDTDPCPGCRKEIKADALVCIHCGYDFRKGAKLATATGAAAEPIVKPGHAPAPHGGDHDLIRPGRGSPKVIGIGAAAMLVGACVAAGVTAPASATPGNVAARVGLTALDGILHTGTGLIALSVAAFYLGERLGRVELGAARIALAWSAFLLVHRLPIPAGAFSVGAAWLAGLAAYLAVLWALMARNPRVVAVVAGTHFGLYVAAQVLLALVQALDAAQVVNPLSPP